MTAIATIRDRLASGAKVDLRLTVDGLRDMVRDLVRAGHKPICIIISEHDRRDLNDDFMSISKHEIAKEDANNNRGQFAFIEGVPVRSNPEVQRGKARVICADQPPPTI